MSSEEERTVGERGQVTIPKGIRERLGIDGGDEVVVREDDGRVVIEKPVTREELAAGYRATAERAREIAEEMEHTSSEADDYLGDAPDW
ncbi:AbrB/MazE/SpoVT family DNA-binding domain-containing protein [Halosimplex halobium]|uniref:AbrB/MazE/SpoVT family DNA-binding domain-containing protein n=1 Tax=Halosimplex halobium TaxID=3396618 RepID=UPI003F568443